MKLTKEYRRIFNSDNVHWSKNTTLNLFFLKTTQSHLNDMLKARGHLMLNEAYDALGFPRTAAGAVIGWVYEEGNDLVDFGLGKWLMPSTPNWWTRDAIPTSFETAPDMVWLSGLIGVAKRPCWPMPRLLRSLLVIWRFGLSD